AFRLDHTTTSRPRLLLNPKTGPTLEAHAAVIPGRAPNRSSSKGACPLDESSSVLGDYRAAAVHEKRQGVPLTGGCLPVTLRIAVVVLALGMQHPLEGLLHSKCVGVDAGVEVGVESGVKVLGLSALQQSLDIRIVGVEFGAECDVEAIKLLGVFTRAVRDVGWVRAPPHGRPLLGDARARRTGRTSQQARGVGAVGHTRLLRDKLGPGHGQARRVRLRRRRRRRRGRRSRRRSRYPCRRGHRCS
ncbi:hypothetical protein T484DRAFT_3641741, partial [Baffinella frigidus]